MVDSQGNIEFPVIGKINTENKSTEELRDILKKEISKYVLNPQVSVKNTNYKITVLGEVNKPGTYNIPYNGIENLVELLKTKSLQELKDSGEISSEISDNDIDIVMTTAREVIKNRVVKL